jgi:hypothetical protein
MAWVAQGQRFTAPVSPHDLGPGQYHINRGFEFDNGYAPFGSTNPRSTSDVGAASTAAPGAGSYDPQLPSSYDSGLPRKMVPFASSAMRIDVGARAKKDFRPGPGNYKVVADLKPPQRCRTMGTLQSSKPVLRSSSAPSIPQAHQSFGYEEVGNGRLVRQGPKIGTSYLTGRPEDAAGPGQYDPDVSVIAPRAVNGSFPKGAARTNHSTAETPGPGHYQAKKSIDLDAFQHRMGSSFASASDRGDSKREVQRKMECPGPGSYGQDLPRKPNLREMRSELQYFGSTVERFKADASTKGSAPDTLGPGSYAQIGRRPEPPNAKGFCITQERFQGDKASEAPGPGSYERPGITDESMTGPLSSFSMLGNQGGLAFGSMSKRISYPKGSGPGPGTYPLPGMSDFADDAPSDPERSRERSRKPRPSKLPGAAFASQTPKDVYTKSLVREGLQRPPPGAYDPVLVKDQATVVRLRSKSEGFLSAAGRFPGHAPAKGYEATVGPGRYVPQEITGGKRVGTFNRAICDGMPVSGRPKGLGFNGQDKRFRDTAADKLPGPGTYNTEPGWITKSYNCHFGDLT